MTSVTSAGWTPSAPGPIGDQSRAQAGIDEDETFAGAYEKTAELEGEHSVLIQELGVLDPVLVALVEQQTWRHWKASV
jgi:hypothetical protein